MGRLHYVLTLNILLGNNNAAVTVDFKTIYNDFFVSFFLKWKVNILPFCCLQR